MIRHGLDAFDIDRWHAQVHCSRATIYRYAGGKAQIRDAVLLRLAAGITDTVRRAVDGLSGPERVVTRHHRGAGTNQVGPHTAADAHPEQLTRTGRVALITRAGRTCAAELTGITDDDPMRRYGSCGW